MNGADHFREAERLANVYKEAIEAVEALPQDTDRQRLDRLHRQSNAHALLDKAQVHATLALAAATALPWADDDEEGTDWRKQTVAWTEAMA